MRRVDTRRVARSIPGERAVTDVNDFESPTAFLAWLLHADTVDEGVIHQRLHALPHDWWAAIDGAAAEALYDLERQFPPRTVVRPGGGVADSYALVELKRRLLQEERQRRAYHP